MRTYTELSQLTTFEDRYRYLRLLGRVGSETFGFERHLNQSFYRSKEWRNVRNDVILRDSGCDLGILDRLIPDRVYIHHMNPLSPESLRQGYEDALDMEYLISVTHNTHNAIHYGDENLLVHDHVDRQARDTTLWTPIEGRA